MVAFGGALWQLWGQEREKEFEVWKEQLGKLFDYIRKYYMPVARNIFSLNKAVKNIADPRYKERVFYYFVMFWMRRRLLREKGGWFLSNKKAEELLNALWIPLWGEIESQIDDRRVDEIADLLNKPVSPARFRAEFVPPPAPTRVTPRAATPPPGSQSTLFVAAETEFLNWAENPALAASFKKCISMLLMMRMVLAFEWDRPFFGYWYGSRPEFDRQSFRENLDNLAADSEEARASEAYLKSVEKYWRK